MRSEIITVGTELLLGHVVDTNAAWLADQLASSGVDCHRITTVGDNVHRIAAAITEALTRSDAAIVCGGLGPTQDDVTREAIADVMKVPLVRDDDLLDRIRTMFLDAGRTMAASNARQADVPQGAAVIPQRLGTAPGLACPAGSPAGTKVIFALPGVPAEMKEMTLRAVLPDLERRAGVRGAVIMSRVIRTWGLPESTLAEMLGPRMRELGDRDANPTLAFQASGIEGIKVRATVKERDRTAAAAVLDREEGILRDLLGVAVFGIDSTTMEQVVGAMLIERGLTIALAESLTGGLMASRLVGVPGASNWLRGSVVAYGPGTKQAVLGIPDGPVVTQEAARQMAGAARRLFGAEVGLSTTGVAGPDRQEETAVGTVHIGLAGPGEGHDVLSVRLPGDREQVRQLAVISALDHLRRKLTAA